MRCFETGCGREVEGRDCHSFSGYGFYLTYCAEHCLRSYDDYDCEKGHTMPSKDKVLFYLTRRLRDAEDLATTDLERMAKDGKSYTERRAAVEKNEEAQHEVDALRAAVECVREHYPDKP